MKTSIKIYRYDVKNSVRNTNSVVVNARWCNKYLVLKVDPYWAVWKARCNYYFGVGNPPLYESVKRSGRYT